MKISDIEGVRLTEIINSFVQIHDNICSSFEKFDGKKFTIDAWKKPVAKLDGAINGWGETRHIKHANYFEKGGVNFSYIEGAKLPKSATKGNISLDNQPFIAMGVSVVMHPQNPFLPTAHANVRLFFSQSKLGEIFWWFGGGFDLTPYFVFIEDVVYWHQQAKKICDEFGYGIYDCYKKWCDSYFYLTHRAETRGVGGLFFDELSLKTAQEHGWEKGFSFAAGLKFIVKLSEIFASSYVAILQKRKHTHYEDIHKQFQKYRRGRYVEFNMLFDRGTIFGIQSRGRTESILISLPPEVNWSYNIDSNLEDFQQDLVKNLKGIDWLKKYK